MSTKKFYRLNFKRQYFPLNESFTYLTKEKKKKRRNINGLFKTRRKTHLQCQICAILFLFVALQQGVSTGDSFAISDHTEQSPVYPWGGLPFEIMRASFHTFQKLLLQKSVAGWWKSPLVCSGTSLWGFFVSFLPFELFANNEWKTQRDNCHKCYTTEANRREAASFHIWPAEYYHHSPS